jgi:hypothetical protein
MKIDWTISASNLLVIAAFFITILYRMSRMETKVDMMWRWFVRQIPDVTRRLVDDEEPR